MMDLQIGDLHMSKYMIMVAIGEIDLSEQYNNKLFDREVVKKLMNLSGLKGKHRKHDISWANIDNVRYELYRDDLLEMLNSAKNIVLEIRSMT